MTHPSPPSLLQGQLMHFGCLAALLVVLSSIWRGIGEPHAALFWLAVSFPIMHQIFVWLSWRLELANTSVTRSIGFQGYTVAFFGLFIGRFVTLALLAWYDQGSLGLPPIMLTALTLVLAMPGLYAIYSVHRYFGLARAAGADHFEERYRHMSLVDKGIFRFTDNGMYVYAFMLFWAIAVGLNSVSALLVVAFSHAYIWVHFYATEKPDMEFLYGSATGD